MDFRDRLRIGAFALMVATLIRPAIARAPKGGPRNIISAYARKDQGPGNMKLMPGYVAGLPRGSTCIDTECGGSGHSISRLPGHVAPAGCECARYAVGSTARKCSLIAVMGFQSYGQTLFTCANPDPFRAGAQQSTGG